MATGLDSFTLLAIPFFVLAGQLMNRGGIASATDRPREGLLGSLPGGLAHVNVLAAMLFGAISGSAVAAASAIGGDDGAGDGAGGLRPRLRGRRQHHVLDDGAHHPAVERADHLLAGHRRRLDRVAVPGGLRARPARRRPADGRGRRARATARLPDRRRGRRSARSRGGSWRRCPACSSCRRDRAGSWAACLRPPRRPRSPCSTRSSSRSPTAR